MRVLLVGLGGFVGSVLRYWLSGWIQELVPRSVFPFGTLAVNVVGCLAIGLLSQLAEARSAFSPETRALFFIGLLGGFTTFSSFGHETINLWRDKQTTMALANIAAQLVLGLAAVWLGRLAGHRIWG
jgi:CrcB protein